MFITWHGHSCFRIQDKDATIIIDPYDQKISEKPPIFKKNEIVVLTDSSLIDTKKFKESFVVNTPGEYETQGYFIQGLPINGKSIAYFMDVAGITVAHLGNTNEEIKTDYLEIIEEVDVLFIPVGGGSVYDAKKASAMIQKIEPKIVIPMSYKEKGIKADYGDIEPFLKEEGIKDKEKEEKTRIIKKDLPIDKTIFTILEKQ